MDSAQLSASQSTFLTADAEIFKMKTFFYETKTEILSCPQHPQPVQFVSNLFLPGGFELARYSDSKVRRRFAFFSVGNNLPLHQ